MQIQKARKALSAFRPDHRPLSHPAKAKRAHKTNSEKSVETLHNVLQNKTSQSHKLSSITDQLALSNCCVFELLTKSKRLTR